MSNSIISYKDSNGIVQALLIKATHSGSGIEFLTKDDDYMQVAYMGHPAGHVIKPHFHNRISRIIDYTCETLIIRKGRLTVSLYEEKKEIHSFEIGPGDVLTLFSGGHGFIANEELEMIEIKQGPFLGACDKTRFEGEK